jgi:Bax protein
LVRTIPDDLGQVREVERRKDLFLAAVLPLALAVNEQINAERVEVTAMARKISLGQDLTFLERDELDRLARVYRVIDEADDNDAEADKTTPELSASDMIDELLLRAAPLPVSLVLAQAAEESAWGLSRFAAEGNALYGQWVWNDGLGIIPKSRADGQTHSVRAFRDIYESTLSYAHNLNTHRAYSAFRNMRANMLNATGQLDGFALAGTLTRYSGRGQAYVTSLRSIIRTNDLSALDRARLGEPGTSNPAAT